ncbi:MAG: FHA domain-containing protein [Anaerolineae bacterium]|nr:FHA domain-containing protein [Anaerolineae bacterium]MDW8299472.1 FHA domain-containing protein [Anaerolineae bacterium]
MNRIGVVFCEQCGASLIGDAPLGTRTISSAELTEAREVLPATRSAEPLPADVMLRIEIPDAEPILLKHKRETIFGRRDPATGAMPDVDMTPFAGYRLGVSRRHAAIRRTENNQLELWDLGSSNGTYLNGVRLVAHRPNRLNDGDEIRLGQMVMRVRFVHTAHPTPRNADEDNTRSHT